MLFEPAGEGADEVLAAELALPVLGLGLGLLGFAAGGGAGGSDVVGGLLEDDFGHGVCVVFVCVRLEGGSE